MAGPENDDARNVNNAKAPIPTQKLGKRVANAIHGIDRALPIIGINGLAHKVFFSYLSAIIPPTSPEASPRQVLIRAFANE